MIRESLVRFLQERVPTLAGVHVGNNPDLDLRSLARPFALVSFVNTDEELALLGDAKRWDNTMVQVGLYAAKLDDQRHFAQKIKREFDLMTARDENGNPIPGLRLMGIYDRLERRSPSQSYFSDQPNWTGDVLPHIFKNGVLFGTWAAKLEGDVVPESATPAWTKTGSGGVVTAGNDLRGLDLKVFKVTTDGSVPEEVTYTRNDSTLSNTLGTTIDLRHFMELGALTEPLDFIIRDGTREATMRFNGQDGWAIVGTTIQKVVNNAEWHSIRFTLKVNTAKLYVDGVLVGTATITTATTLKQIVFTQVGAIEDSINAYDYLRYATQEVTDAFSGPGYFVNVPTGSVNPLGAFLPADTIQATYSCGFVDFVVSSTVVVPPGEAEDALHKFNTFFTLNAFLHLKATAGKFF